MENNFFQEKNGGYAALIATIITLGVSLAIVGGLAFLTFREVNINQNFLHAVESNSVAEGGAEDAVYRVVSGKQISSGETVGVGQGTSTVIITLSGNTRTIRTEGVTSGFQHNIETQINTTTSGVNFRYGVQVGNGGVDMENGSAIVGNIYSNGSILGKNNPLITGDAFAADVSAIDGVTVTGNARAHDIKESTVNGVATSTNLIDNTLVGKNAYANRLQDTTVTRDAYFMTKDSNTVILGSQFPNTPAPADLPVVDMPISDAQIQGWEQNALAGGVYSGPCPLIYDNGSNVSLGPQKIACDLVIRGSAVVTITGPVWVQGNIDIKNTSQVQLSSSYGALSGMIIADDPANPTTKGLINVDNSAVVTSLGASGSYLMLVSGNTSGETGGDVEAISLNNTGSAAIYYAPHGIAAVGNKTSVKEVTAWKLSIKNTGTVNYESGLQNAQFSTGPAGGFDVILWKQAE